jgi:hypothetical protein
MDGVQVVDGEVEFAGVPVLVREAMQAVHDACGGVGFSRALVDAARDEGSVLHPYFEWDDAAAGDAFRLVQAGNLIRRVTVNWIRAEDRPAVRVRAFVSARQVGQVAEETRPGSYVSLSQVAGSPAYEAALLQQMRRDVAVLRRRYQDAEELLGSVVREVFGEVLV